MVIVYCKEGRLANRLWQAAHFAANAIEHQYRLLHIGFGDYFDSFHENLSLAPGNVKIKPIELCSLSEKEFLQYAQLSKKVNRRFHYHLPFVKEIHFHEYSDKRYDLGSVKYIGQASSRLVCIDGWFYTDNTSVRQHSLSIRKMFTPNRKFLDNIQKMMREKFSSFDYVVGVHIRRGDYKTYRDGQWFYSDSQYNHLLGQVSGMEKLRNKRVGYLLCSDEKVNLENFKAFQTISTCSHEVEDLYLLSECDFIVGPPSSYSAWASFYGQKPVLHFDTEQTIVTQDAFKVFTNWPTA